MPATRLPLDDGFMMPAEWAPHECTFVSWPCRELTWGGHIDKTKAAYADVIRAISRFELVKVLASPSTFKEARTILGPQADLIEIALDDSWIRDNGPVFVRSEDGRVSMVKFKFNAWGVKSPSYDNDDRAPITLAKLLNIRHYDAPMVLEGGAISVDGDGTLLTTEQCLLNRNRNPDLSRDETEHKLRDYLGIRKVIWLGRGVEGDMTDGHVDGVACFAGPRLVLAAHTKDQSDPNFVTLKDNLERLECATDAKGRSIEVIRLVQPRPREVEGIPITPGFTNHYVANGGVVMPTYGIPEDRAALETLMNVYPSLEVMGVNCSYIEIGGGAIHCITQQMPAGIKVTV